MTPRRQTCVRLVASVAAATVLAVVGAGAVALSDDPVSAEVRPHVERGINAYLEGARVRAAADKLGWVDKAILHFGILGGGVVGQLISPEGVAVLWHAVYGDGSELRLDPEYVRESQYVAKEVKRLGPGEHGPIWVPQPEDWRLTLALNPIFIVVTDTKIRVGHPNVKFAEATAPPSFTIVPLGKIRLKVADNLVGALHPVPFAAWAEWTPTTAAN